MNPIRTLNELLTVLALDLKENGGQRETDAETRAEIQALMGPALKTWSQKLPSLRTAIEAALAGRGKDQALAVLATEIQPLAKAPNAPEAALLDSFVQYFQTEDPNAWSKIVSLSEKMNHSYAGRRLAPKNEEAPVNSAELRSLVQEMTGRPDTRLTKAEQDIAAVTHIPHLKRYQELRDLADEGFRRAAQTYVRNSGQPHVPYHEMLQSMIAQGIDHALVPGFTGLVDENLDIYCPDGNRIDGNIGLEHSHCVMGDPHGGGAIFHAFPALGGDPKPFFTEINTVLRSRSEFDSVSQFIMRLPDIQAKWQPFLAPFAAQSRNVLALILELAATYGAPVDPSGVTVTSARQGNDGMTIEYPYEGAKIRILVPNGPLTVALTQLMMGKRGLDPLFTVLTPTGQHLPVTRQNVLSMFKLCGGPDAAIDVVPRAQGTRLFIEFMADAIEEMQKAQTPPQTYEDARLLWAQLGEQTAQALNAELGAQNVTAINALARLIDPSAQIEFWHALGFRVPEYLDAALYKGM